MKKKLKNIFITTSVFTIFVTSANASLIQNNTMTSNYNQNSSNIKQSFKNFENDFSKEIGEHIKKFNPKLSDQDILEFSKFLLSKIDLKEIPKNKINKEEFITLDGITIGILKENDKNFKIDSFKSGAITKSFYKIMTNGYILTKDYKGNSEKIKINRFSISNYEKIVSSFKNFINQNIEKYGTSFTEKEKKEVFNKLYNENIHNIILYSIVSPNLKNNVNLNDVLDTKNIKIMIETLNEMNKNKYSQEKYSQEIK